MEENFEFKELPLDEINVVIYLSKRGSDFEMTNEIIRELENNGSGIEICTDPKGLIENGLIPIIADLSSDEIVVDKYDCLIIGPLKNSENYEDLRNKIEKIVKEFHGKNKIIIFLGNSRSVLFDLKLIDVGKVEEVKKEIFKYENIIFHKNGDREDLCNLIIEELMKRSKQRKLVV